MRAGDRTTYVRASSAIAPTNDSGNGVNPSTVPRRAYGSTAPVTGMAISGLFARLVPSAWMSELASETTVACRGGRFDLQQLPGRVQILHLPPGELPGPGDAGWPAPAIWLHPALWTRTCSYASRGNKKMLWTICVVLLILWALGLATSYTAGGLVHILLVVALVVMVIRLFQGRRIV